MPSRHDLGPSVHVRGLPGEAVLREALKFSVCPYSEGCGMIGLLICASVALLGAWLLAVGGLSVGQRQDTGAQALSALGLALIAVALWLAYAAGGA